MRVVLKERRRDAAHINVAEGRAVLRWLQRVVRTKEAWDHKLVIVVDSRVVKGAFDKGRSPSWSINRIIQQVASLALVAGLWLEILYTPSEFNVGDLPSRHRVVNQGERRELRDDFFDRLGLIRDLGTPRQRGPPLRGLASVVHRWR